MKIPNAENAYIDIRKLRDYVLDPNHHVGQHKARLFAALLDMSSNDAEELRDILLEGVKTHDALPGFKDEYGQRYQIDLIVSWRGREVIILSAWIIRPEENFPRLVTCYPLEEVAHE
jgi:hypothetical protein